MTLDAKPAEKTPATLDLAALRRPSWQTGTGVVVVAAVILWSAQTTEFSLDALVAGSPTSPTSSAACSLPTSPSSRPPSH
jgi:phosphonate transport system permease protein